MFPRIVETGRATQMRHVRVVLPIAVHVAETGCARGRQVRTVRVVLKIAPARTAICVKTVLA